jgi:hypothetical protein
VSVKKRCILAAVTVALGVGWVWCASVHHQDEAMHLLSEGIRSLFIVAALALVLACLVTPMSAALNVGRQIGRAEQRRDCGCRTDRSADPRPLGRVVEFKPGRRS